MSVDPKNDKTGEVELTNEELDTVSGGEARDIPVIPPKEEKTIRDAKSIL